MEKQNKKDAPLVVRMLDALLILRDTGPKEPTCGICGNVTEVMYGAGLVGLDIGEYGERTRLLKAAFQQWPRFSGERCYPVPAPDGGSAEKAFLLYRDRWSGEYGDMRRDLLDFTIEYFEKKVQDMEDDALLDALNK